jgi:catechol 2,3-dioxygenase-like lactoylglutathione lyase family enzyme
MPAVPNRATPIVPCNDLEASASFYSRLGFRDVNPSSPYRDEYRILEDGEGAEIHLQPAVNGWLVPGKNPFGVYLSLRRVRDIAAEFGKQPFETEYGALEIALSDPDETLVRVGWPVADLPSSRNETSRGPESITR